MSNQGKQGSSGSSAAQTAGLIALGATLAGGLYYLFASNRSRTEPQRRETPRKRQQPEKAQSRKSSTSSSVTFCDEPTDRDCPICYEKMNANDSCYLPCVHRYHVGCIEAVFGTGVLRCPVCRNDVPKAFHQALKNRLQ